MNGEKVERRGGARANSGRKKAAEGEFMEMVYFRLSPGILAKVDALAEERGVSRSAFLRQVVLDFFVNK